jgi:hypothetical protein
VNAKTKRMRKAAAMAAITILTLTVGTVLAPIASAGPTTTPSGPIR